MTSACAHAPVPPGEAAGSEILEALRASVSRAIDRDAGRDDLAALAAELGLFELGTLDPDWEEGGMALYARALFALAQHHGALARTVARGNAPPDVRPEARPAAERRKATVDSVAILAGRLSAAVDLATAFALQRTLFRRRLIEVPAIDEALARARSTVERASRTLLELAGAPGSVLDESRWSDLARDALHTVSGMLQLMGGTGLMVESHMPGVHRDVLTALAELPAGSAAGMPPRLLSDVALLAPGPGGVPLDQ